MQRRSGWILSTLMVSLAVSAGCAGPVGRATPPTKRSEAPKATRSAGTAQDPLARAIAGLEPRRVPAGATAAVAVRLSGAARLLSDRGGGIISDNGGGIISNNSGAIVSNNAGSLISDRGAGLVSNNGGGASGAGKYRLRQAPAAEFALADAVVTLHDAAGRVLVDAAGTPIAAKTDAKGNYHLEARVPTENLVVRIKLWQGGTLSAILPRAAADGATSRVVDLDTASSIGTSYVLEAFVRGDQATYDKLPGSEADRLRQHLLAAQALVVAAPRYDAAELVNLGERIRQRDPLVDRTLTDIKALLLGQSNLGAGRQADEVPLASPDALVVDARGRLLIGEAGFGRIRAVETGGALTTWVDTAFGTVRRNFFELSKLALAPDGRVIVFSKAGLAAIAPDGAVSDIPLGDVGSIRVGLAVGPDGTVFVGHGGGQRVTAVPATGAPQEVPLGGRGELWALTLGRDGRLYALCGDGDGHEIWRGNADGLQERVATGLGAGDNSDLAVAADGTLFVTVQDPAGLLAIAPDGTRRVLAGAGAEAPGAPDVIRPTFLHLAADGTLYVADDATAFIYARSADGRWRRVAGSHARIQDLARGEVTVNGPGGAAFDRAGRLIFTEVASHTVKRFDGTRIETLAGTVDGFGGDGGPATAARLSLPRGVAVAGDDVYVVDTNNSRLRRIGADGIISTVAGAPGKALLIDLSPGRDYPPGEFSLGPATAVAIDASGRPVWSTRHQLIRLGEDGTARAVAGQANEDYSAVPDLATLISATFPAPALEVGLSLAIGVAADVHGNLHVADAAQGQIFRLETDATKGAQVTSIVGIPPIDQLVGSGSHHVLPAESNDARKLPVILPAGVCFDPAGNLYFSEMGTRHLSSASAALGAAFPFDAEMIGLYPARVRKLAPDGRVTTIAGPGGKFFSNPDAEDALVFPGGLAFAPDGRLAILDPGANMIRILPAGSF